MGDAPIQGAQASAPVEWRDFCGAVLAHAEGAWDQQTNVRPLADYVLFDLGVESLLEPIVEASDRFRVTIYNLDLMRQSRTPGRHQDMIPPKGRRLCSHAASAPV